MDCPFKFDDAGMENDDAENRENSHPNISNEYGTLRKRVQDLRGMAFRFSGKCTDFTFSDGSQLDRIHELNTKIGNRLLATKDAHDPLNSITYVVLSYDISRLSSSAETCDIPVIGYIQSAKQVRAKTLKQWMGNELEWKLVPGGLCGSSEFTREILNSSDEWVKYTVYGKLGLNNLGSKEVLVYIFLCSTLSDGNGKLIASNFLSGRR